MLDDVGRNCEQVLLLRKDLKKYFSLDEIIKYCKIMLQKMCFLSRDSKWMVVQDACFKILTNDFVSNYSIDQYMEVSFMCLKFLLFPEGHNGMTAKTILKSSLGARNSLLAKLGTHLAPLVGEEVIKKYELMQQTWKALPDVLSELTAEEKAPLYEYIVKGAGTEDILNHFVSMAMLNLIVKGEKKHPSLTMAHKLADACLYSLTNYHINPEGGATTKNEKWLKHVNKGFIPLSFISESIQVAISAITNLPSWLSISSYWNFVNVKKEFGEDDALLLLVKILKCVIYLELVNDSESVRNYIVKLVFKSKLKTLKNQFYFLSMIWSWQEYLSHSELIDEKLQLWCLGLGTALANSSEEKLSWIYSSDQSVIPSLIVALCCGRSCVRKFTMKCMKNISLIAGGKLVPHNFASVVEKMVSQSEELIADAGQLPVLIRNLYETDKKAIDDMIGVIIHNSTPYHVKSSLLFSLSNIQNSLILKNVLPLASTMLELLTSEVKVSEKIDNAVSMCLFYIILQFSPATAHILDSSQGWEFFLKATNCTNDVMCVNNELVSPQTIILDQVIDHKFFLSLKKSEVQAELWMILVHRVVMSENAKEAAHLRKALRRVSLNASLIVSQIDKLGLMYEVRSSKDARKRQLEMRKSGNDLTLAWRKLGLMLEFVAIMNNLEQPWLLVGPLCRCLKSSYVYEMAINDIIQQQILTALHHLVEISLNQLPEDSQKQINLSIEIVIQCIRSSVSPDTHRRALLVLSLGAKLYPDDVLKNIMAIFTFMGTSLLRRDDSYSFQVIHQAIESIIPTLIKSEGDNKEKLIQKLAQVTQVFVDALPDLPEHRRLSLFKQLAVTLGVNENLWVIMTLLVYSYIARDSLPEVDEGIEKQRIPRNIAFSITLNGQFSVVDQVQAVNNVFSYISSLPINKAFEDNMNWFLMSKIDNNIIKWHMHTPKQYRHFIYNSVGIVNHFLSSEEFISSAFEAASDDADNLKELYELILKNDLCFLKLVTQMVDKAEDDSALRFWSALQKKLIELLDRVNSLLPPDLFVEVISNLLQSPVSLVRCRAMEMLCGKLQTNSNFFYDNHKELLLPFIKNLKSAAFNTKEQIENRQTALYAIQLLIRFLSSLIEENKLLSLLMSSIQIISQPENNPKLLAQCTLLAAESVVALNVHSVEHLPQLIPTILQFLSLDKLSNKSFDEYLVLTNLTALNKVRKFFNVKYCSNSILVNLYPLK